MEDYGIDSIMVIQLTNTLRKIFGQVSSTLFFEAQTIDALVQFFIQNQREKLSELVGYIEQKKLETPEAATTTRGSGKHKRFLKKKTFANRTRTG